MNIEHKMRKRTFLETQDPRESKRTGTTHQNGRVVTWEVTCSETNRKDIIKKLTGEKHRFRLYGAPISLIEEHSETDSGSDSSSSQGTTPTSSSEKDLAVRSPDGHQKESPIKRAKTRRSAA